MKKNFIIVFVLMLVCGCSSITSPNQEDSSEPIQSTVNTTTNNPATDSPKTDNQTMSIEEKIGQMFFVRCDNENINSIMEKKPGGLLMFGVDFENLTKQQIIDKISSYQKKSDTPLLIGVDEEGGTVVRVSSNSNLCDKKYKSPQQYYNEGGMEKIEFNAIEKSQLLKSLGINMNLAPVADVSTNKSDFIYDRSFGKNAKETAKYVSCVVTAMKDNNMASCLKHFPGYGNNVDTHTGIAIDERSYSQFEENDFLPFISGIAAGADSILVSHNIIKCIDKDVPASISPSVHDILRNELDFNGIIMTDDMSMDAMKDYGTPYIKAVNAGNDMIIVTDFDTAYNEVLSAVKSGKIKESTIDKAIQNILEWKKDNLISTAKAVK